MDNHDICFAIFINVDMLTNYTKLMDIPVFQWLKIKVTVPSVQSILAVNVMSQKCVKGLFFKYGTNWVQGLSDFQMVRNQGHACPVLVKKCLAEIPLHQRQHLL